MEITEVKELDIYSNTPQVLYTKNVFEVITQLAHKYENDYYGYGCRSLRLWDCYIFNFKAVQRYFHRRFHKHFEIIYSDDDDNFHLLSLYHFLKKYEHNYRKMVEESKKLNYIGIIMVEYKNRNSKQVVKNYLKNGK